MAGGYMGKLLMVDLSTGRLSDEPLDEGLCRNFIGGYGIGAKMIYDRQPAGVDPLSPANMLGFLTGPLTGTPAIIGSRFVVVSKSPLTGTWGDANSGGYFGPNLKFAGYDGVMVTGAAEKPVYLLIEDGQASLRDASHLWGKNTIETRDMLKAAHGKETEEACIGPSGESQSLISCVINDYGRAAGRSGLGAVMGAKKLKAIAVRGAQEVPLANAALVQELRRKYARQTMGAYDLFHTYGTPGVMEDNVICNDAGIKNWAGAGPVDFPNYKRLGGDAVVAEQERRYFCWQCTIGCGGHMKPKAGRALPVSHKPEYETLGSAGSMMLNDDLESVIRINDIVNAYGLDSISAPCTVAFAVECYENGLLTKADTDGLELRWGNSAAIVAMTEKLAKREGFGAVLADGVKKAAERIGKGSEQYAMHVQGQEVPQHDPRYLPGLAINYQLDATPARHTQGSELIAPPDLKLPECDKYDYASPAKIEGHKMLSHLVHLVNATGLCLFGYISYPVQSLPDFLNAVTGSSLTLDDCFLVGERIGTQRHLFNLREGLNPLEFQVPPRLLGKPPLAAGNTRGVTVDNTTMIENYLKAMDWDPTTARPSQAKLQQLGLA